MLGTTLCGIVVALDHKHRKQKEQQTIKDMMGILSKWEKSITIVGILQRLKLPVLSLRPGYEPCN